MDVLKSASDNSLWLTCGSVFPPGFSYLVISSGMPGNFCSMLVTVHGTLERQLEALDYTIFFQRMTSSFASVWCFEHWILVSSGFELAWNGVLVFVRIELFPFHAHLCAWNTCMAPIGSLKCLPGLLSLVDPILQFLLLWDRLLTFEPLGPMKCTHLQVAGGQQGMGNTGWTSVYFPSLWALGSSGPSCFSISPMSSNRSSLFLFLRLKYSTQIF